MALGCFVIDFQNWGLIEYKEAAEKQLLVLEQVASGEIADQVIFCSHPEVVTLGKSSSPDDLIGWKGQVCESSRGGKATYHGPEQLVVYPIINLNKQRKHLRQKDIHQYLRRLEESMIVALKTFGLEANRLPTSLMNSSEESQKDDLLYTGVWVGEKKLASIGIAVKRWVTYHGLAINLWENPSAFTGINPCGFQQNTMTHIESVLGERLAQGQLATALEPVFTELFAE